MMEPATTAPKQQLPRRFRGQRSPFRIGLLSLALTVMFVYLAFSKSLPWQAPFEHMVGQAVVVFFTAPFSQ